MTSGEQLSRHMARFRAVGEVGPVYVQAQFLGLLCMLAGKELCEGVTTLDVDDALRSFLAVNLAALDSISPGFGAWFRANCPVPGKPTKRH